MAKWAWSLLQLLRSCVHGAGEFMYFWGLMKSQHIIIFIPQIIWGAARFFPRFSDRWGIKNKYFNMGRKNDFS
jgi:hypothetical protein